MIFRKMIAYATPFVLIGGVAATPASSANLLFPDYASFKDQSIVGTSFTKQLAKKYQDMSVYEYQEMYDYIDAETYAERGQMAQAGTAPQPFVPANWDIDDPTDLRSLEAARRDLVAALGAGAGRIAPNLAAEAQTKFDCWVEQQEEGWQTAHIALCRDGFKTAMVGLHEAMMPEPEEQPIAAAPEPTIGELERHVIYFDFDDFTLNPAAQSKIDAIVARLENNTEIDIFVEGHADTAGPSDYNFELAKKRAEQVRAELIRQGLEVSKVDDLVTESEGETEPAVQTGDGVREQGNRRVEVIVRGIVEPQQSASNAVE